MSQVGFLLAFLGIRSADLFVLHLYYSIVFPIKVEDFIKVQAFMFVYVFIDVKHRSGGLILRFVMLYRCRFA